MQGALLLDVVVRERATIFQLLTSEDETLLVWGNALLVLDLGLDVVDRVGAFYFQCDGLSGEGLDENLHTTTQTKDQVQGRLFLDVVIGEGAAIFKLLAGEDQTLLVGRDALLVLNLRLDVVDRVGGFHLQGDGLSGQGLDEDLHTTAQAQDQVKGGFLLDVVVGQGTAVLQLLTSEDQALLIGRDTFLILDLRLDVIDGVAGLDLQGDGLASQGLDD